MWTFTRVMALDYDTLDNNRGDDVDLAVLFGWPGGPKPAEANKETFTFRGAQRIPRLSILPYTDPRTGQSAEGVLEVTVEIAPVQLSGLRAQY
jgi:hypothetical protein